MREQILAEIKRIAAVYGKPPGKQVFERETGIREHQWSGVIWAKWTDALTEAGLKGNVLQTRLDTKDMLLQIVEVFRFYGRTPSQAEMKLYRLKQPSFPNVKTISKYFPTKVLLVKALSQLCDEVEGFSDVASLLPTLPNEYPIKESSPTRHDGSVYLLRSGDHYKIGRSDELERRVKEIRIALPDAVVLIHSISTDDPAGIEAYWHRRFADRRANGEWFKLTASDVSAFKKLKRQ